MKSVMTYVLLLAGVLIAGSAYARGMVHSGAGGSSDMSSLSDSIQVRASIESASGDDVRIFAPAGNNVLCKGDLIPVYRSNIPSGTMSERSFQETRLGHSGDMSGMTKDEDLSSAQLVGEVRVDKLLGDNHASGKLIAGSVSPGDIATKPNARCLAPELNPDLMPQG